MCFCSMRKFGWSWFRTIAPVAEKLALGASQTYFAYQKAINDQT